MIVCVDAIGIRDGGGVSVLSALIEQLPSACPEWYWIFYVDASLTRLSTLVEPAFNANLQFVSKSGWSRRLRWLSYDIPRRADKAGADVIFSLANISPLRGRIPNVLFVQQRKAFEREGSRSLKTWLRFALLRCLVRHSTLRTNRIIVQTSNMRELIGRQGAALAEKTVVVPSPVRTFHKTETSQELASALAGATGPRLLYVSVAREHKNHAALIEAFSLLRRRLPDACLWLTVAGPDDPNAGPFERTLHALARDHDVVDAVRWLGLLDHGDVATAYTDADLTVFPSLNESYGLPLAESMLAGTPVSAADLPYAREMCGDAAAYFDPLDPEAMAVTIGNVLASPDALAELRKSAIVRARRLEPRELANRLCRELEAAALGRTAR